MKRFMITGFFLFFIGLAAPLKALAVMVPETVKVGLESQYKQVGILEINNNSLFIGYENQGQYAPEVLLESANGFRIQKASSYYAQIAASYTSYEEAKNITNILQNQNIIAYPALVQTNMWQVYIPQYTDQDLAVIRQTLQQEASAVTLAGTECLLQSSAGTVFIQQSDFVQLAPVGSVLDLGNRQYRGRIIPAVDGGGITAINVVSLEEYLYGVVPSEMPAEWHEEALKAQALCARSFAYIQIAQGKHSGYDLCDRDHCQVYSGYGNEHERSNQAVLSTKGQVITYEGEVIESVYSSSSGGSTENSEDVWVTPLGYLRGITDPYETESRAWVRTFSKGDLERLVATNGKNIGTVLNMAITGVSDAGRVTELTITGSQGSVVLQKEGMRTFFSSLGGSLESKNFTLSYGQASTAGAAKNIYGVENDGALSVVSESWAVDGSGGTVIIQSVSGFYALGADGSPQAIAAVQGGGDTYTGDFILIGKGWGHGVGMSQYGAKNMAEQGFSYDQIIKHYYTGVEIHQ